MISKKNIFRAIRKFLKRPLIRILLTFIFLLATFSYLTNPFVRFSLITDPFNVISFEDNSITLTKSPEIIVADGPFIRRLAYLKSGWHIFANKFSLGKKATAGSVEDIIKEIHALRFDPQQPFLISGDHFSMLYPRSLGIFYHSLLDPRTALSHQDWHNRQTIYLKTLNYALQSFKDADHLSTTIVPIGPRSVALIDIYAPPSETLYSLLYALNSLSSSDHLYHLYPYPPNPDFQLSHSSINISHQLLDENRDSLIRHLKDYEQRIDPESGLIRKNIVISSTKDLFKRQSAFYDNVILYQTQTLAQQLNIKTYEPDYFPALKQTILSTYWHPDEGFFIEDLSPDSLTNHHYSSDWLIAYMTGFLDPSDPTDLPFLQASVDYIRRNALDQPFALQYQSQLRRSQQYLIPRLLAPEYGSTAIWSNWGMEYIKLLSALGQVTGDDLYLQEADRQLSIYAYNIKRYRGYPEVYNSAGDFFQSRGYKSVRRTGWVVSYEQARALFGWTKDNWNLFDNSNN